jgi:hypothetical protein
MSALLGGVLLPDSVLKTEFFAVLAAFVAINTLLYVTLSIAKILPKAHPLDWWYRLRHRDRRRATRGIHPEAVAHDR